MLSQHVQTSHFTVSVPCPHISSSLSLSLPGGREGEGRRGGSAGGREGGRENMEATDMLILMLIMITWTALSIRDSVPIFNSFCL